jgi:IS30 family transposase
MVASVVARLRDAGSPEQIAGQMRLDGGICGTVCHETIYQYVYGRRAEPETFIASYLLVAGDAAFDTPESRDV